MKMEESATLISGLPHDVALEILIRIPVKGLIRLSCLNKTWHIFIFSNPSYFARSNLLHHQPTSPPKVVWLQQPSKLSKVCCHFSSPEIAGYLEKVDPMDVFSGSANICFPLQRESYEGYSYLKMISCCDGVFCLLDACRRCSSDAKILLWNPTLRQCNFLAGDIGKGLFPADFNKGYVTIAVGFGFDSLTQDYIVAKVQYIWKTKIRVIDKVSIYRLSSYSWTTIYYKVVDSYKPNDQKPPPPPCIFNSKCVILKGYLYWLVEGQNGLPLLKYIHVSKGGDDGGFILIPDFVTLGRRIQLDLCRGLLTISVFVAEESYEHWRVPERNSNAQWEKLFVMPPMDSSLIIPTTQSDVSNIVTACGRSWAFDSAHRSEESIPGLYGPEYIECIRAVLYDPISRVVVDIRDKVRAYDVYYYVADNFVYSLVCVKPRKNIFHPLLYCPLLCWTVVVLFRPLLCLMLCGWAVYYFFLSSGSWAVEYGTEHIFKVQLFLS